MDREYNYQIISIDGNIGSGKSTIMKYLKQYYANNSNVVFMDEPVDLWNKIKDSYGSTIIEKFYGDQKMYAFPFQIMALTTRMKLLNDCIQQSSCKDYCNYTYTNIDELPCLYIITERGQHTDTMVFAKMLFEEGKINEISYNVYLMCVDLYKSISVVDKIIYVKAYSEKCAERICKRNRNGEKDIDLNYLMICEEYHEKMMNEIATNWEHTTQLVLDGNIDLDDTYKAYVDKWLNIIDNYIMIE
jgi:deoxyadenosine/deoxycytidine kinase